VAKTNDKQKPPQSPPPRLPGRPRIFETPEDMEIAVEEYFEYCEANHRPLTIAGLAMALGMGRTTLHDYSVKGDFAAVVKRAKRLVEVSVEERLFGNNATGSIFWLKNNAGYKDVQQTNHADAEGKNLDLIVNFITAKG
jgi:hypothetical protein